ncbi:hypothetical protein [Fluviicola chungangensis]|uniref:Uncharacterized protein n=1 Tax=Fluviicola chungangensis TaxID=2597671 RepID=A0A556N6X1_9FLAO|nr:hypothetical protein [Fluviicola chungangensis]TSJ47861.1 hypothetical protein FO442_01665 [Fluviicola chungangensis]
MNKIVALLLFTLVIKSGFGQNTSSPQSSTKTFDLISDLFDLSGNTKIGSLSGNSVNMGSFTLSDLFNSFWNNANKQGANSFTVDSIIYHGDTTYIEISIYSLNEAELKTNRDKYPRNKIYVFGNIDKRKASKKITINDRKIELKPLEYISYQNQVDEETIVSIGGSRGATMRIIGKEGRQPLYLSASVSHNGISYSSSGTMSFNRGRVHPVDFNFGAFLVKVLPEKR